MDNCENEVVGRGLCNRHYYAAKAAGTLNEIAPKVFGPCDYCGGVIAQTRRWGSRYCSTDCKEKDRTAKQSAEREQRRVGRECAICGGPIVDRNLRAKTCSRECSDAYQNQRKRDEARERWDATRAPCIGCGAEISPEKRAGTLFCSTDCKRRTHAKRWREKSPHYMRNYLYGVTPEQYDALLLAQDNRCAICRTDTPGGRGTWCVDHCHDTERVRGLLCNGCNTGLGQFQDDPDRLKAAAEYLLRE